MADARYNAADYELFIGDVKVEGTRLEKYPKRFRDMSVAESDVHGYWSRFGDRLQARAKRLLPLWRRWGLEQMVRIAYEKGYRDADEMWKDEVRR